MGDIHVDVVRVFADEHGDFGNRLGLIDGGAVPDDRRQAVARELGFSETVFIDDPATGRIRLFTPGRELPFAGHPMVGTAWWLREQGHDLASLNPPAGEVTVTYDGDITRIRGHLDWVAPFVWHDLDDAAAVEALDPASFADAHHYAWAWIDEAAGRVRSRMFAPAVGVREDEATGMAAVALTVRLERDLDVTQGRGSRLSTTSEGDGWATVGGRVVPDGTRTL
ncbi:MAG TPA: PhzF family phenazine biosynthesis protein [Kribbellaceae bacterium]